MAAVRLLTAAIDVLPEKEKCEMHFTKMQGIGNDYVYLDCTGGIPEDLSELARKVSDRHFGIGSDGLICICPSKKADFRMRMFNADGSESEMCGNGIRCVGKYVYDKHLTEKTTLQIETLAGIKTLELHTDKDVVSSVTVDMGVPAVGDPISLEILGRIYKTCPISMGNPHAVIFLNDVKGLDITEIGPRFEHHPAFPNRTNTEFVEVIDPTHLRMRVWERGSGETLACGTGACATLVAAAGEGLSEDRAIIHLLGGDLEIFWNRENGHVYMTGPAVTVFEGELA